MKIAILTQPLGHNYGGIMQAWALQQVLKSMGHEPITIDRQPDARGLAYRSARTVYRALRRVIGKRKAPMPPEHTLAIVATHTRDFIRANITMSPMIDTTDKLRAHFTDEGYEAVIVGSDQTWRPAYSPNLYNFFLDFLPDRRIKKLSYASSFGVDNWEFTRKETKKCAALVRDFDFISVREISGVKLCAEHLGVSAEAVLDPTLLLSTDDYRALIERHGGGIRTGGGLYTYLLDRTPVKNVVVQRISDEFGLPIFEHQARRSLTDWRRDPIVEYVMPPVTDWLSGFEHADLVVTDSFHGMVFSILFEKPLLVISNQKRGAARFSSLLSTLDLSSHILADSDSSLTELTPTTISKKNIDILSSLASRSKLQLAANLL